MADNEQNNRLDRLTSQLSELPSIIGRLGISVASAQKALNAEYVTSLQEIMKILNQSAAERTKALRTEITAAETAAAAAATASNATPDDKTKKAESEKANARLEALKKELDTPFPTEVVNLIKALAPSRYQFSETTLDFSADLSQTLNVGAGLSLGVGTPAVTVSASFSLAYGFDYRAAARIKTILHALPEPDLCKTLLARAEAMDATKLTLQPKDTAYSQHMIDGLKDIAVAIAAPPPAPISTPQGS